MVEMNCRPVGGYVAVRTDVGRREMICRLARRRRAVMAAFAGAKRLAVIEVNGRPAGSYVTVSADVACREMIGGLACRIGAVVASFTSAGYRGMVKMNDRPASDHMAVLAISRGLDVTFRLSTCA